MTALLLRAFPLAPWRGRAPSPAAVQPLRSVLLASEGRAFSEAAIAAACALAEPLAAEVHVFAIARVWGSSLGFPSPGLLPSKREWDIQRRQVAAAVAAIEAAEIRVDGRVVGTRNPTRRILGEAARLGCGAIVMGADPPRHWALGGFSWAEEPHRVRRRAPDLVHLVHLVPMG